MKQISFLIVFCIYGALGAQIVHSTESETGVEGKHYRFPQFNPGVITRVQGTTVTTSLNYNLVTEEIVVDLGHTKMPYKIEEDIESIKIEGVEFMPINGIIYERLSDDPVSLLVHRRQQIKRLGQNTGLGRSETVNSQELPPDKSQMYELLLPGAFEYRDINAYVVWINGQLKTLNKLKDVQEIFPPQAETLKNFMKKERIKMHHEDDLIKLINYAAKDLEF